jgi:hypothetical protein
MTQATWRLRLGRSWFKTILGKKFMRPHLNQWLGTVMHTCHPKLQEAEIRMVMVPDQPRPKKKQYARPKTAELAITETAGSINGRTEIYASLDKKKDSIPKVTRANRTGGVVHSSA